ncbi:MAG: ECF transporter S component, partial [Clostridia bacterium]
MKKAKFAILDLVLISLISSLGIASKVVIGTLIRNITSAIGIPGGAIAGGFYMLWLALAVAITKKPFAATICATIQMLIMLVTGLPGSHGIWSVLTYILPGFVVDITLLLFGKLKFSMLAFVVSTMLANLCGTVGANFLFFHLPAIPMMLSLSSACLSGAVGGVLAYLLFAQLKKTKLLSKETKVDEQEFFNKFEEKSEDNTENSKEIGIDNIENSKENSVENNIKSSEENTENNTGNNTENNIENKQ